VSNIDSCVAADIDFTYSYYWHTMGCDTQQDGVLFKILHKIILYFI